MKKQPPHKYYSSIAADISMGLLPLNPNSAHIDIDLTAMVSCFNEAEYIHKTLSDIFYALRQTGLKFEIIVIDDMSSDNSVKIIKHFIDQNPEVILILRENSFNNGLAQNYIDGAFLGRGKYYKLFCGDNSEPPDSIIKICSLIGQADIIIPNYVNNIGKSKIRKGLSNSFTHLINLVSGNRLKYYNGLPVQLRYSIMRWHPNTRGFGFQADITCMLLSQGMSYIEVSVPSVDQKPSGALTWKNFLSVGHTVFDILVRRFANLVYTKH